MLVSSCAFSSEEIQKQAISSWIQFNFPKLEKTKASQYSSLILQASSKYNIKSDVLTGLISTESSFKNKATSHKKAKGLTQVVTKYHKEKIQGRNLYNPSVSIDVGAQVLRQCLDNNNQNYNKALGCYSGHGTKSKGGKQYIAKINKFKVDLAKHIQVAMVLNANHMASEPMELAIAETFSLTKRY